MSVPIIIGHLREEVWYEEGEEDDASHVPHAHWVEHLPKVAPTSLFRAV